MATEPRPRPEPPSYPGRTVQPSMRPSPLPPTRRTTSSRDRRVQIAAAKARVTLDRRLGVETPKWIVDLANAGPG